MAHRVISLLRSDLLALGAKRTSTSLRHATGFMNTRPNPPSSSFMRAQQHHARLVPAQGGHAHVKAGSVIGLGSATGRLQSATTARETEVNKDKACAISVDALSIGAKPEFPWTCLVSMNRMIPTCRLRSCGRRSQGRSARTPKRTLPRLPLTSFYIRA
jgi:hypothetical protein